MTSQYITVMSDQLESDLIEFCLKLDKLLFNQTQNVVISPFCLATVLSMTLLGAHNKSGKELSKILFGKVIGADQYHSFAKKYHTFVDKCLKTNEQVLSSANFLYSDVNYPILQNYKQLIETNFNTKLQQLDFNLKNKEAVDTINNDISFATKGKIPELFESLKEKTKIVLANALYFKGMWKLTFNTQMTTDGAFMTNDGTFITTKMMHQVADIPYIESQELSCRAIQLGYQNSNVVMIALLPNSWGNCCLAQLKDKLNVQTLNKLINEMKITERISISLPRFKIETQLNLIPILRKLGIKRIFDKKGADFSGIASNPMGLYIGEAVQKVIIEVNEEGTEATAATGFAPTVFDDTNNFRANRPFMFILVTKYDSNKNVLLFTATVNNPNNNEEFVFNDNTENNLLSRILSKTNKQ